MNAKQRGSGIVLLVVLVAAAALFWGLHRSESLGISGRSWETLNHGRLSLDDFRGRGIVLSFFSTICLPCKPGLTALSDRSAPLVQDGATTVIAVCVDPQNHQALRSWANDLGLTMPILLDFDAVLAGRLGVEMVPETYVMDADGQIALRIKGWDAGAAGRIQWALMGGSSAAMIQEAKR
jgi:peroxiredoxin